LQGLPEAEEFSSGGILPGLTQFRALLLDDTLEYRTLLLDRPVAHLLAMGTLAAFGGAIAARRTRAVQISSAGGTLDRAVAVQRVEEALLAALTALVVTLQASCADTLGLAATGRAEALR
jgi:hypothetical protein